ncbi:MAG TPA: hypothetical protein VN816_03050 [Acidimicrobiales bacterium]|nr:hypothetical protein [Acidimicrobiales bacterium]
MPAKKMIAAATRFKEAWNVESRRGVEGRRPTNLDVVELHEAALGLICATGTRDLSSALAVLHDVEATPSPPPAKR